MRGHGDIVIVLASITIAHIGQGIISPVLPLFADEFGIGATIVGFVVSVFGLGRLLLNVPAGIVGERLGRKPLMIAGLLLSGLFMGLTGLAHSVGELILWRFLAGAGNAIFTIGAVSYIIDASTPANRGRLLGLQQGALLLGTDIGPIIGGVVADWLGFRWSFYVASFIYGAGAFWVIRFLPGREVAAAAVAADASSSSQGVKRGGDFDVRFLGTLLRSPTFILVSAFSLMVFFTRSASRQTILPLLADERIAVSATSLGLIFTVMTTINTVAAWPVGAFSDRYGRKALLIHGSAMTFLGLMVFAFGSSLLAYYVGAVFMGIGAGIVGPTPNAYAGDLAPPGKVAVTMGMFRTFNDVGYILGPILLGAIAQLRSLATSMGFNAVALMALAIVLYVVGKETAGVPEEPGNGSSGPAGARFLLTLAPSLTLPLWGREIPSLLTGPCSRSPALSSRPPTRCV